MMSDAASDGRFGTAFEWLGIERAWTRTRGSPSVVIAIIERGVQTDHPLIGPNIQRDPTLHAATNDHERTGTYAAGIVAGRASDVDGFSGVAPDARILPVRYGSGEGPQSLDLAHAIEYAVEAGACIVNLSRSCNPTQPAAIRAIQYAAARNVLVVCAASVAITHAQERGIDDPLPNQLTVLSVNQNFQVFGDRTEADLAAPSFARVPQWRGNGHITLADAPIGAAYVSGCAALVKTQNPGWGYHELKEHLFASSRTCPTGRLLDVANAVLGPIAVSPEPLEWSGLTDTLLHWKMQFRLPYCTNAVALYRRHGDEHWRELAFARANSESMVVPASAMKRSSGMLRIACRESNFYSDEVPLIIR